MDHVLIQIVANDQGEVSLEYLEQFRIELHYVKFLSAQPHP